MANVNPEPTDLAFSEVEFRERVNRAKDALKKAGFQCGICVGPELLNYYAGYDAHTHFQFQALIISVGEDDPTLILRDVDKGRAEVTSWVKDLRVYRHVAEDPVELVATCVREKLSSRGRIGSDLKAYAFPGDYALRLNEMLAPFKLDDFSKSLDSIRLVKSEQEMSYINTAAGYATIGLERAYEIIRPGITEIQVAGEIEYAMRKAGSEYPAMPVWVSTGSRRIGHKTPDHRVIEAGDNVSMEFAGVHRRYHAVTMQTMVVGSPYSTFKDSYNIALRSLRAGQKVIHPGIPVSNAEQAVVTSLVKDGFDPSVRARFGYGVGIGYPPTWLESLDITLESDQIFQKNMTFVLHTGAYDPVTKQKILVGGAYATTDTGIRILSGGDLELRVL